MEEVILKSWKCWLIYILDENKNLGQGEGNIADVEWQTLWIGFKRIRLRKVVLEWQKSKGTIVSRFWKDTRGKTNLSHIFPFKSCHLFHC